MDVSFQHPHVLWALLALPVLALFEWRALVRAARAVRALVGERDPHVLLAQLLPGERRVGMLLRTGALALLLLGAAGPQWGHETVRRNSRGSDLVFAIDVSASMDTRDVLPSRLDEAQREAMALLERVEGSRVGVLVFAGDANRLCPLTLDHAAARLTLQTLSSRAVSMPGTDVGRALVTALQMLPAGRRDDQGIVLWTDGEDLEGRARQALDKLRGTGVRVFAVGVGTPAGDVIPVTGEEGQVVDVKHDEKGNVVRSQLDERLLRDLGRSTHGAYFAARQPGGEIGRLASALGSLSRSSRGARLIERPVARFGWCAAGAALLAVLDLARPRRRRTRGRSAAAARRAASGAAASAVALVLCSARAGAQTDWARGDAAFRAGNWAAAESLYARRARHAAPAPVRVNLATAREKLGHADTADRELSRLVAQPGAPGAAAAYNLGTLLGERRDFDRGLAELRRALERNPADADARWNYELLVRERDAAKPKPKPKPESKQQQPQQPPGGQGGKGQPQPQAAPPPPAGGPGAPPTGNPPPSAAGGALGGMTRQQAEQLLGSLQELERLEKQRARMNKVTTERRGKDW